MELLILISLKFFIYLQILTFKNKKLWDGEYKYQQMFTLQE
jgi:hypothetical protein